VPFIVPPGGFAGFNQMTPASRAALGRVGGTPYKKKRRRSAYDDVGPKASTKRSRRARMRLNNKRRKAAGKMKFGSPAWQRKYKVGKFRK